MNEAPASSSPSDSEAPPEPMTSAAGQPHTRARFRPVLLLHGGHLGAWVWAEVIRELEALGVEASAIDLPSRSPGATLADDERKTREELAGFDTPVVMVGHSYSGAVISAAATGNDRVAHLVFAAAAVPLDGQSVASALRDELQEPLPPHNDHSDWVVMEPAQARQRVFNDATDEQFEAVLPKIGHYSSRISTEVPSGAGWREHPSTYLVCALDQSFPLEVQRRFADCTTYSVDIEAGHAPMVTKPIEVAQAIAAVARHGRKPFARGTSTA